MTIATSRLGMLGSAIHQLARAASSPQGSAPLSSLRGATAWVNSRALSADDLRGKVVLVDFGTYTCINWLRTLPYVREWAARYGRHGLVVIGVHTPEFSFEFELDNVRRALGDLRVEFPIAVDNGYEIWRAFANRYWPAVYLLDAGGRIRFRHFGEGEYERTAAAVRRLLAESGAGAVDGAPLRVDAAGVEAAADWESLGSPETYLGHARTERFASRERLEPDARRVYSTPPRLALNRWALSGEWTVGSEFAVLHRAGGHIALRFRARDIHLVMARATRGTAPRFRVRIDGQAPGASRGLDVDVEGRGRVLEPRMYQLVRQTGPVTDRSFDIEFDDPGLSVFAFTFG